MFVHIFTPVLSFPILENEDNTWKPFRPMVNRVLKDADFMSKSRHFAYLK